MDMVSTDNVSSDVFHGGLVIICTLVAFIGLVWLREQILLAGGPDWLERENVHFPPVDNPPAAEGHQQQNEEERVIQQPEAADNNNVPPFVDDPPRVEEQNEDGK